MNKPQSIEDILDSCIEEHWGWDGEVEYPFDEFNVAEAKAAIEAMVRDIIGEDVPEPKFNDGLSDIRFGRNEEKYEQRLRASKYNLKLEKE